MSATRWEPTPEELRAAMLYDGDGVILEPKAAIFDGDGGGVVAEIMTFPEPEDRGAATLSALGEVEYVDDLVRPGRIVLMAAEEGTGKSYFADGELAIRCAVAGGDLAGTWPVLQTGPVLVLSEMHPDDDYQREQTVLEALGLDRSALTGHYYRLSLATAAGDKPALTAPAWRAWITDWMREHGVRLAVVDTATAATQVDPWGAAIQGVYRELRVMLDHYPELAIVLVVHLKKPQGRGERRISDVLGEWGRWCDVLLLLEADGGSLERVRVAVRKRVRHERRIVAIKRGGLLVEPHDMAEGAQPKVPLSDVVQAIKDNRGIGNKALGDLLGVSKDTAGRYAAQAWGSGQVWHDNGGPRGAFRYFPAEEQTEQQQLDDLGGDS